MDLSPESAGRQADMAYKIPVIYSIHGHPPDLSSGGPFRLVGDLLNGLTEQCESHIEPILVTWDGIYKGDRLQKSYARYDQARCVRVIKRIVSHRGDLLPFACFMLSTRILPVSPVRKLQAMIAYADRRTGSLWRRLRQKGQVMIVHSHLNTGAIPYLKDRDARAHKVVVTYHSKGSLVSDYSSVYAGLLESSFAHEMKARERFELHNSDVVVFPSRAALKLMETHHPRALESTDVRIIRNGIDVVRIDKIVRELTETQNRPDYGQKDDVFTMLPPM